MTPKNHILWVWRGSIGWVHIPCSPETTPGIDTSHERTPCSDCGRFLNVGDWPWCPHESTRPSHHSIHANERAVVWEHPTTGEVRYPGRNDRPIPEVYAKEGFVRKEFPTLRSLEAFEHSHGVINDKAHYDDGSGHSADDEPVSRPRMSDSQKREIWDRCVQEVR